VALVQGFIAELQRRNVIRVAVLYAVMSWVMLQVAGFLFGALELPASWTRLVIAVLLLGFPVALIFAWVYELTPEGLRRESEIDREASVTRDTGRKINLVIVGLLLVAIAGLIADRLFPRAPVREAQASSPSAAPTAPVATDDRSVAVLPFVNMSSDKEQDYFSDGLTEEMITLLAHVPKLRVIGRTSSFQFKGKNEDLRDIAHKLGVAHVLEGSVRKAGDRVRITAQLVRADDGSNVWSDTYDDKLDDVFKIQDKIADKIVGSLQLTLTGDVPRDGATCTPAAHDLVLKARGDTDPRTREGFETAIATYKRAIDADADCASAYVGLASAYFDGSSYANIYSPREGSRLAHETLQHALEIAPNLAEAHVTLGGILFNQDWDWDNAAREFDRAQALTPGDADLLRLRGYLAGTLGRFDEAIDLLQRSIASDPQRAATVNALSITLRQVGRYDESEALARKVVAEHPEFEGGFYNLALTELLNGKPDAALADNAREMSPIWKPVGDAIFAFASGDRVSSDAALAKLTVKGSEGWAYQIAEIHAFRGENDAAFEWLERAYALGDSGLAEMLGDPLLRNIESDPRYVPFLEKMRLPTDVRAYVPPAKSR
jgi:TolB-like protein/Flp pilus assembly protein TadD